MTIDSGILRDWPGIIRGWYDHLSSESKEDEAIAFFEEERWGRWGSDSRGRTCPNSKCRSSETVPRLDKDTPYRCLRCGQLFSVRTETDYAGKRPMWEWLLDRQRMLYVVEGLSREEAATKIFEDYRWRASSVGPVCPVCPHCRSLEVSKVDWPAPYRCRKCRKHFSARVGTAFQYGKIPLWRWLDVIILYGNGGRLTNVELAERLDVESQNTALGYHDKLIEAFRK